jgi:hypothetical protein
MARARPHSRPRWAVVAALVLAVLVVGVVLAAYVRTDPQGPSPTSAVAPATTLPAECADALAIADELAVHAGRLANAAVDHVVIMDRLDLFLDGKPGGLDGHQVYRLGEKQMKVMEADAPDAQVRAKRYLEVRKRCPLK